MVEDIVRSKIRSLMRCLDRVQEKLPATAAVLAANVDAQDIIVVNLERAVQQAVDIAAHLIADRGLPAPANMADAFNTLRDQGWLTEQTASALRGAVGFRNIAVHEYQELNWDIVFSIGSKHLDDFRRYVEELEQSNVLRL